VGARVLEVGLVGEEELLHVLVALLEAVAVVFLGEVDLLDVGPPVLPRDLLEQE